VISEVFGNAYDLAVVRRSGRALIYCRSKGQSGVA